MTNPHHMIGRRHAAKAVKAEAAFGCRVTVDTREKLQNRANAQGITLSRLVRDILTAAAQEISV